MTRDEYVDVKSASKKEACSALSVAVVVGEGVFHVCLCMDSAVTCRVLSIVNKVFILTFTETIHSTLMLIIDLSNFPLHRSFSQILPTP